MGNANRKESQECRGRMDTHSGRCIGLDSRGTPEALSVLASDSPAFKCYEDTREVYSQIYDRFGNALTYGDIVDWLNEWAATSHDKIQHGINCEKVQHNACEGYLHAASDDSPYPIDGVWYCGRCHHAIDPPTNRPPTHGEG